MNTLIEKWREARYMEFVEQQQTSGEKFPTCLFISVNGGN